MGTVLIRALIKTGSTKHILVCERNVANHNKLRKINSQIQVTDNVSDCADADVIFLAVKPQDFGSVKLKINERTLVCSIMAGISIAHICRQLKNKKVVRMMPNIAARAGEGLTAWTAAFKVSAAEKKWIKNFLIKIGAELYVKKEEQIDKATAVIGSGPAYIFNTLSIFINAAEQLGFKPKEAYLMVRQVLRGASALADEDVDFAELARQVTSKGGTTEAALKIFNNSDFKKIWVKAIGAAYKRARELSK